MDLLLDPSRKPSERDADEEPDLMPVDIQQYRQALHNSKAFPWLVSRIKRDIYTRGTDASTMESVSSMVMQELGKISPEAYTGSARISRWKKPESYSLIFHLDWNPVDFHKEQGYQGKPDQVIGRIITVTGDYRFAQVLSCQEYMERTWPITGVQTLDVIREAISRPTEDQIGE
jgi:hypothetical protein